MSSDGDELAKTATATPSSSAPRGSSESIGDTLGRYRLERVLGAGGMGVVHAAFDPDLERRIALKVLRGGGSEDARKRLLREARAMARLNHPNIVTVHEVASVGGRDYVAMELVEGETLAEWVRAGRRPQALIIDAFVAAGRGLAAAHAAGIVHRDFKPHNVLRSKSGRIVVTDFGLAREAGVDALETTLPTDAAVASTQTPSTPLVGLTVTGSVLGTPAYMAPEQWTGGKVSPATDQFAFCVALWEALAGERPFRGATAEALREEVTRGPAALDVSKIPRSLRRTLIRGLDPDPAKRFPSMDALLRTMKRAERRPLVFLGLGVVGMLTIAIVFALAIRKQPVVAPPCPLPAIDPATVWSPQIEQALVGKQRAFEATQLAANHRSWLAARQRACEGDPAVGVARRACLDSVLARFDVVARAVEGLPPGPPAVEPGGQLIDPAVCELPTVPRLVTPSQHVREVISSQLFESTTPEPTDRDAAAALVKRVVADPCASALARIELAEATHDESERDREQSAAAEDAERCGDDRVRAEVALRAAMNAIGTMVLGSGMDSKLKLADTAVARVAQPDLQAMIRVLQAARAQRAENADEAIRIASEASQALGERGLTLMQTLVEVMTVRFRQQRGRADDIARLPAEIAALRARVTPLLGTQHDLVEQLVRLDAGIAWGSGDLRGARQKLATIVRVKPNKPARVVEGRVVDQSGKPVAGVRVIAATTIIADSLGLDWEITPTRRTVRTASDGTFEIRDAPHAGVVIAELDYPDGLTPRRSHAHEIADRLTLVLEPTSKISGKVDLGGASATNVTVVATDWRVSPALGFQQLAPVRADGTFELAGAPRTRVRLHALFSGIGFRGGIPIELDIQKPSVEGVALALGPPGRRVEIVVRSTIAAPVGNALVRVYRGKVSSQMLADMLDRLDFTSHAIARQIDESAPPSVKSIARDGDLYATGSAPEGEASACAIGLPAKLTDELDKTILKHVAKIEVRCVPVTPGTEAILVEVPPWPRLD